MQLRLLGDGVVNASVGGDLERFAALHKSAAAASRGAKWSRKLEQRDSKYTSQLNQMGARKSERRRLRAETRQQALNLDIARECDGVCYSSKEASRQAHP
ncbi:unnamed protein product [Symbiodinium necroappetens]|uniref:Uncharacterized protein n=1 Tax=Symbiodinium necroappetens TaxID=1628268 RepID=A0A813CIT7_9DINO|nr:unnamed protein product [Symbiodinium necroappetens]